MGSESNKWRIHWRGGGWCYTDVSLGFDAGPFYFDCRLALTLAGRLASSSGLLTVTVAHQELYRLLWLRVLQRVSQHG
jgi:hypothetical protein